MLVSPLDGAAAESLDLSLGLISESRAHAVAVPLDGGRSRLRAIGDPLEPYSRVNRVVTHEGGVAAKKALSTAGAATQIVGSPTPDEFVYVLAGAPTLVTDEGEFPMGRECASACAPSAARRIISSTERMRMCICSRSAIAAPMIAATIRATISPHLSRAAAGASRIRTERPIRLLSRLLPRAGRDVDRLRVRYRARLKERRRA